LARRVIQECTRPFCDEKLNVVLFHKSARVQTWDIPKGTEFNTTLYKETDDEYEIDCYVMEAVPSPPTPTATPAVNEVMLTHLSALLMNTREMIHDRSY
jgi:hypothetical protein